MGIVLRQSFYSSIIAYIGVAIGYLNLLYLYPKFLDPEQIGLLRTVQDSAILFTPFAQFGLAQSIVRYYPRLVRGRDQTASFVTLILLIALAGFTIFFICFKLFESSILSYFDANANEIISYSTLVVWLTLILLMLGVLESYSRTLLKTVVPNLLREIVSRLLLSLLVFLYFIGWISFNTFIISTALAYLFCLVALIGYLVHLGELRIDFTIKGISRKEIPNLIKYSALSFAGTAGLIIVGKIDGIMVSAMIGLTANAVYTTAFYMATVIEVPKRALSQLTFPLISRAFERNDFEEIKTIYKKTSINQLIIGTLILLGIIANLENIFQLIPKGDVYQAGMRVVVIIGLGKLLDMAFGPNSEIIVMSKYFAFNIFLIIFLSASVVVANNLLIPVYGIDGAAIGSSAALILFNLTKFGFVWYMLKVQPFSIATLKVVGIGLVVFALNYFLPHVNNIFVDILYRSVIITAAFGGLVLLSRVSPDGNTLFEKGLYWLGIR